jgi:glycosyltransferase involved in cell wall biosynthesis
MKILQVFDKAHGNGIRTHVESAREAWLETGVEVCQLRVVYGELGEEDPNLPTVNAATRNTAQRTALNRLLRDFMPDVAHVHAGFTTISTTLLAMLRQALPSVGVLHDVSPVCFRGTRLFRGKQICTERRGTRCWTTGCYWPERAREAPRQLARSVHRTLQWRGWCRLPAIVVPSNYLRELTIGHGADPTTTYLVPHFVEPDNITDGAREPELIFVGRLASTKGIHVLIEALVKISDLAWHATIIGEGPERMRLHRSISDAGLDQRVRLMGAMPREALSSYYRRARCLVFPSLMPEAFGLAGAEALAHGCPVVGFCAGGANEWLQDETSGLIARPHTSSALAGCLRTAVSNPARMACLGRKGRDAVVARFGSKQYLAAMGAVHRRLGFGSEDGCDR